MPSHKPIKTYQKKTRQQLSNSSQSVDAINALFAQNLTKRLKSRRKAKLKLKELPPRIDAYLTDESLNVDPNNTFDKLLKGKVYNKVKVGNVGKIDSSQSESSKSKTQISVSFHSPIMTRRRKKANVVITDVLDSSREAAVNESSTLDKQITGSLSIEKQDKGPNVSSLSYIKLPKITENEVMNNNTEETYQPIFSETFRERQAVHSSTPCVTVPAKKIVADPISPITKSDSSNSSQLIEKSYDQIRKWDENFPNLEETPQRLRQRRKLVQDDEDWKLLCHPKVYLKTFDRIDTLRAKSKRLKMGEGEDPILEFSGFTEGEQLDSSLKFNHMSILLERTISDYEDSILKHTLPKLQYDPRKRKRSRRNSLKTPARKKSNLRRRSSKRSVNKRKSKRIEENSQEKKKIENDAKSNKLDLKEKRLSTSVKTMKTRLDSLKNEKTRPLQRSARILQKPRTEKFPITPKRSTKTLQSSRKTNNPITPPRNLRRTTALKKTDTSALESLEISRENSKRRSPLKRVTNEGTQPYITLRRRKVTYSDNSNTNIGTISSSRRTKMIKPLCINITDDILSEKEVSYSHSSFDFSTESSHNKISYTTEELKQDKEISLPKINPETNENVTFNLHDFDNFMQNYIEETEIEKAEAISAPKQVPSVSIITLSDDDMFEDAFVDSKINTARPSAIKIEKLSTSETRSKNVVESTLIATSLDASKNQTTDTVNPSISTSRTSNTSSTTPKIAPQKKVIILSNISLGISKKIQELNDSVRRVQHDHMYCSPVAKPQQKVFNVEEVHKDSKQNSGLTDIVESSFVQESDTGGSVVNNINNAKFRQRSIKLKPGKSYRRSLSLLRRSSVVLDSGLCQSDCVCLKCLFRSKLNPDVSRKTLQIVPILENSPSKSILESYARSSLCYVREEEEDSVDNDLDENIRILSLDERRKSILQQQQQLVPVTAKEVVLRRCGQTEVSPFEECYPGSTLQHCRKIGEGVYGEVFLRQNPSGGTTVMKVIPIEGDLIVNGERQKKFDEILSEIVIAMELSNLRNNKRNTTSGFSEVQKVRCTRGTYPDRLIDLWDLYDETKGSENDSPLMFPPNQTYIVLELANGGSDLESFVFNNAAQAFAMFKQTACALAVAENQLKFEHRDLHWGNVLLSSVDRDKTLKFRLDGKEIEVETLGVEVAIIDFTLSRIEFEGVVIFNDLSLDNELFVAQGDYQFEIYRAMQKSNGNEWQHFEPYTNILWLHYVLDKAVTLALRYKNTKSKIHKEYLSKLKKFKDEILSYNSVVEFVSDQFL